MANLMSHEDALSIANKLLKVPRLATEDISAIAISNGVLAPAVADVVMRYPNDGSEPLDLWLKRLKPETPHWYKAVEPEDGIDKALIERACGAKPTLAARAELYKTAGAELYFKLLASWGASSGSLAPGTNPKAASEKEVVAAAVAAVARKPQASNPWSKAGWNITQQGKVVSSLGLEKASGIAQAAGCRIGFSTKPNPDFN